MDFAPPPIRLRVARSDKRLTNAALANLDHVVMVLPRGIRPKMIESLPFGSVIKTLRDRAANKTGIFQGTLQATRQVGLTVATAPEEATAFARLSLARQLLDAVKPHNPARVGFFAATDDEALQLALTDAFVRAALVACAPLPSYKSSRTPKPKLRAVTLFGDAQPPSVDRLKTEAQANHLARWLTAQPPNVMDAKTLVDTAVSLANQHGFDYTVHDELALTKMGANAFLAVARANAHSDAAIVHLRRPAEGRHIALVGKGVCYDTGGINVKPANYMLGMHEDMEGSAVALASFIALSQLDDTLNLECWLAVTENRISSAAYTPNEVIKALNGTTIEVIHSDAEGRMALADTLTLASRNKPELIIDYATLTGACVAALTTAYTGVFTNRETLNDDLVGAGRDSGERVWPFPLDGDYDKAIESQYADVKQCAASGSGDHIHAARFLQRFVDSKIPWVHMDLSAGNNKGGLAHIPTDVTGFGVHVTTAFVLDRAPELDKL
ncbi:MAG: M17 family metallopeptidase [Gammaproteobacteria bacterium]